MPRVVPNIQYVINQLRRIARHPKASASTQLRACDRIIRLESLKDPRLLEIYEVTFKDQEPESGEKPEPLQPLDPAVVAMMKQAGMKIGGDNGGDQLPNS